MKNNKPSIDIALLALCELAVAVLVIAGYAVADMAFDIKFSYRVITGAALGTAVTVLNYVFLTLSVNRAINRFIRLRGNSEMDDEAAEKFAKENSAPIQTAIMLSFIIRTATMLATLILAFILDWFEPLATVIPLLAFRPIIMAIELLRSKFSKEKSSGDESVEKPFVDLSSKETESEKKDGEDIQIIANEEKESDF